MANTLGTGQVFLGFNIAEIQAVVDQMSPLYTKATPLSSFTSYLPLATSGVKTVSVPVPDYSASVVDMKASGKTLQDAGTTDVTVTLDKNPGKYVGFDPTECQQMGKDYLVSKYLLPQIYALETYLCQQAFAIAVSTPTNFATSSVRVAAASFSSSKVAAIQADLDSAGIQGERFIVARPDVFWGLKADMGNKGNSAGASALQNAGGDNPFGIVIENGQQLSSSVNAIAGNKSAIVVATAIPNVQHGTGESVVLTTPNGTKVLTSYYFDDYQNKWVIGCEVVAGWTKGIKSLLNYTAS